MLTHPQGVIDVARVNSRQWARWINTFHRGTEGRSGSSGPPRGFHRATLHKVLCRRQSLVLCGGGKVLMEFKYGWASVFNSHEKNPCTGLHSMLFHLKGKGEGRRQLPGDVYLWFESAPLGFIFLPVQGGSLLLFGCLGFLKCFPSPLRRWMVSKWEDNKTPSISHLSCLCILKLSPSFLIPSRRGHSREKRMIF